MRLLRSVVAVVMTGLSGLALPDTATGQADVPAKGLTIADSPAPAGTRTVCLGRRDGGARVVGCFDVYRIESGKVTDPVRGVDLARYLWKFTAEARADTPEGRLVRLVAGVASDAGSTYDWAPEQSSELGAPRPLEAAVTTDIAVGPRTGGAPALDNPTDGWPYHGLAGWFHPQLSDHRFAASWTAPSGETAPAGAAAQVAGATIWGVPAPGPPLLPARLHLEVIHR